MRYGPPPEARGSPRKAATAAKKGKADEPAPKIEMPKLDVGSGGGVSPLLGLAGGCTSGGEGDKPPAAGEQQQEHHHHHHHQHQRRRPDDQPMWLS